MHRFRASHPIVCKRNATIARHTEHGEFWKALETFLAMPYESLQPDTATFLSLLKASASSVGHLQFFRLVHDHIIRLQFDGNGIVSNALVHAYAKSGSLDEAYKVFGSSKSRNELMWGAMMFAYFQHGHGTHVLDLFSSMLENGVCADKFIYVCVLKACNLTCALNWGFYVNSEIIKKGFELDVSVAYVLVDMYAKNQSLDEASKVFRDMPAHDVVSWGALIGGYSLHGKAAYVLELFQELQCEGVQPNNVILLFVLKACLDMKLLEQGMLLHEHLIKISSEGDIALGSALVGFYSNCGEIREARKVFDSLLRKDAVAWAAMIAGYAQARCDLSALHLFSRLQEEGLKPSDATFSSIMKVCGVVRNLEAGTLLHHQFVENALELNDVVVSALTDMYAKCGKLMEAQQVFQIICHQDIVSWGAMIARFVTQCENLCALDSFQKMQAEGIKPVKTTYLCAIKACSILGPLYLGNLIHAQVIESGLETDAVVGNALINLYSKLGSFNDARKVFDSLLERDSVSWNTIIAGYTSHGYDILALRFVEEMYLNGVKLTEVTHSNILKVCGNVGAVYQGMIIHDKMLRSGQFDAVATSALLSMYANCGCLKEAWKIFEESPEKNVVSWGAITAGYALHGDSSMAKHCFLLMERQGLCLTEAVFTSMLVAFVHAGMLEEGCRLFSSVVRNQSSFLNSVHYSCITDLFGRVGRLGDAELFLQSMPILPCTSSERSLLANCRTHGKVRIGMQRFKNHAQTELMVGCG
ncbi:hypothetical protein KP509_17G015000 [Ceratopteris richardii]|uniref:Pentatricopeptide repeat-containing protein n=1 Tax=Ceratopteris richardii TaxID=49495 RepID=A0A8T2SW39_CERRI|nr:hypothetical protein KP509_17G015000 [Ceratopteris richardii]KAH7372655.1 hypothetical protein KP509_17G015000 [Ceratopteris richardii]KAH7372656.1 hypothetical protein KP509_17G015000 [Ceratopteris richardii]